jgi:hypothetical protein
VALQNQKVLQRSNSRVSEHRVHYEAEFWLSNKKILQAEEKKKRKQFIFVILCV